MLHPLYALRATGYKAEYEEDFARSAVLDFLHSLPGGEDAYWDGVRQMYSRLYELALQGSGKRYFLDKTPAYYFIIPELQRVFPDARYIVLLRNPMAVLSSILTKWVKRDWLGLHIYRQDLLHAPGLLLDGIDVLGERGLVVRYEQLVDEPEAETRRLCAWLEIDHVPEMVDYQKADLPTWRLGDDREVYQHGRPRRENAVKWARGLNDPQVWRFTNDYLHALGRCTVERMGYSFDELQQTIEARRPNRRRLWRTVPLSWALKPPVERGVRGGSLDLTDTAARKVVFSLAELGSR